MPKEISAGAVIFRRDGEIKYLLLHKGAGGIYKDSWTFPRGLVEAGEDEERAARREIGEEAGITSLEFIPGFREVTSWFYRRDGKTIYKEAIFYLAETKIEEVKISSEHIGCLWLNFEDALTRSTFKGARKVLEKANEFLLKHNVNKGH